MLRALKLLLRAALLLAGLAMAYFAIAFGLLLFPVNSDNPPAAGPVLAYVYSNGVHTDLVLPVHSQGVDWSQVFPAKHFSEMPRDAAYVAIGWGDREFYLNTPQWKDLTVGRALQALSGSGHSLLHVSYLLQADVQSAVHALPLSADQYASLVKYVDAALVRNNEGQGLNVPGQHYGPHDAFYEARGSYNLFTTCNTWIGRGLRQAGVKVSAWTPLASQVLWHLPR
jgi:uncharacterized protein (TIGR02117 family)